MRHTGVSLAGAHTLRQEATVSTMPTHSARVAPVVPVKSWGETMMDGNPDSTLTGICGNEPVFVIVDDPDWHVVPSRGVQIIRPPRHSMSDHEILNACRMINMGPQRALEMRKREVTPAPRPERKKSRKAKQHFKGLRP